MIKLSIIKIFRNLSIMMILNTIVVIVVSAFIFEQNFSYKKIENLDEQREIIRSLTSIPRNDIELAKIQFNGKSNMLLVKIEHLKQLYKYDFVGRYIIYSQDEYLKDLDELIKITKEFNEAAKRYYVKSHRHDKLNKKRLQNTFIKINQKLDELYIKNVHYNQKKSQIIAELTTILLLLSLITTFWYRKRLKIIANDILHLSSIQPTKRDHTNKTLEADAIELRMKKKNNESIDPSLIDPVTEVLNHKGLRALYSEKKNMKDGRFICLTVLEIDNFTKANRDYPQELTQAILKKVAFTLTLFEQATDVIARTDYNQFTIIIARATKEQCFKEVEMIRQSISELKFKLPNGEFTNITVSGGFVVKPNNKTLDDTIRQAKEILQVAKERGGNMIAQMSDLTKLEV
ncbi:diguanylate cyclase (GGDEF domain) [hydrothermal vent metagenome]|uniref:Diguanylate cyclase (GGDEF domain) n=1 Tax=hydrothermal vent metagenome TaxID=652676 RepID=A0A1W1C0A1_9ZZZZ